VESLGEVVMTGKYPRFYVDYDELEDTHVVYEDGYELGAYYDVPVATCYKQGVAVELAAFLNEEYNRKQE